MRARWMLTLTFSLAAHGLSAQLAPPDTACDSKTPDDSHLPHYEIRQLDGQTVADVRSYLRRGCWANALNAYFGSYQAHLLSWVVYIDHAGVVHQGFTHRDGQTNTVHGERYVWAMVFSDLDIAKQNPKASDSKAHSDPIAMVRIGDATAFAWAPDDGSKGAVPDTIDLRYARRVLVHARDPMLTLLIKGLGKAVGLDGATDLGLADSTSAIKMHSALPTPSNDTFLVGFARFGIVDNAEIELALTPIPGKIIGPIVGDSTRPIQSVYTNVANARRHTFELGVLTALSYGSASPTFATNLQVQSKAARTAGNAYVVAVMSIPKLWMPVPWKENWQKTSWGLALGTNILNGSIGSELVAAISWGHVLGDAGVTIGSDWVAEPRISSGVVANTHVRRLIGGIDFRL